jgi:hypothetical protein
MKRMNERMALKKKACAEAIKSRLGLQSPPDISVVKRPFDLQADGWSYKLRKTRNIAEPATSYGGPFDDPIEALRETYPQLFFDTDKNQPPEITMCDVRVKLGSVKTSAGFVWLAIGSSLHGFKYCAILFVMVRDLFKGCGISSLLKLAEIRMAHECKFIQTWHEASNRDFISAITPSLKNDFILFHGSHRGGEGYEDDAGAIHLRKYFDEKQRYSIVTIADDVQLRSPDENDKILERLANHHGRYPGMIIKSVSRMKGR